VLELGRVPKGLGLKGLAGTALSQHANMDAVGQGRLNVGKKVIVLVWTHAGGDI